MNSCEYGCRPIAAKRIVVLIQHAEVCNACKHALTRIDTTFKSTTPATQTIKMSNLQTKKTYNFYKHFPNKNRWNVYLTFYQSGQCRDIRQRHRDSYSKEVSIKPIQIPQKNRAHTTALTYYCVNKILAPTHTKVKVCAHVVVGRC